MQVFFGTTVLILGLGLIGSGCKDRTKSQPPSAAPEQSQSPSRTPAGPAAGAADAKTALNDVKTALAKHDLEKATVSLVQVGLSGKSLSDADRATYQSSMRTLQAQLADAAARN